MPRRAKVSGARSLPDPKHNSVLVTKFINYIMRRGKRSTAERIIYNAIDIIAREDGAGRRSSC